MAEESHKTQSAPSALSAHALAKALPLIIIDVIAVYAAYILAGWGTQVFDDILACPTCLSTSPCKPPSS